MRNWNFFQVIQRNCLIGDALNILHIDQQRAMGPQKTAIFLQFTAQFIHASSTLKFYSIIQMKYQIVPHHFTVNQLFQIYPRDTAFRAQYQTALFLLFSLGIGGIHQLAVNFRFDRLYIIEKCANRVGFHCKFRG